MTTETGAPADVEAEVLAVNDRRFDAMRRKDIGALDAAIDERLTYVHSTARFESKADHLANVDAGRPYYRGIAPRERRVRVMGDVALVNGLSDMHTERDGVGQRFTIRFLAAYTLRDGAWRMLAWQSTRLPDA